MKTIDESLQPLAELVQQRDYGRAVELIHNVDDTAFGDRAHQLLICLVTSQVISLPESVRSKRVSQFVQEFRSKGKLAPAAALRLADLYLVAGLRQEASELCHDLLEQHPSLVAAAHRLGLCELSRAATSPLRNAQIVVQRWRRALAYLSLAVMDNAHFSTWGRDRFLVYAMVFDEEGLTSGRSRIVKRLRELVSHHAEAAESQGYSETSKGLRALAVELDIDQAAAEALSAGLNELESTSQYDSPMPFGPLWFETMGAPLVARESLDEVIRQLVHVRRDTDVNATSQFAPTHGINIRQWYSRLAPCRHALRLGQLAAGAKALMEICGSYDQCQVNARPVLPQLAASPKCCSPNCPSFASCNPGYSGFAEPARHMEEDVHRLAIHINLALAEHHALASPPRFLESAQEWVRGRALARVLNGTQLFDEAVQAQVMALLEHYRGQHEYSTELLERAMAAVPGPSIRGRFADRLMGRGIERCNEGSWPEGTADLRWALRLNPYSERAHTNLGKALQNLAGYYFENNNFSLASSTAQELIDLANAAIQRDRNKDEFAPLLEWATKKILAWTSLKDRGGDLQLNVLMNDLIQRLHK